MKLKVFSLLSIFSLFSLSFLFFVPVVVADNVNLAPMFQDGVSSCRWGDANLHNGNPYYGDLQMGAIDYGVLSPAGNPSIRYFSYPVGYDEAGEIDNYFFPVEVGDYVIYEGWIKMSGDSSRLYGARFGIDFYGSGYSLDGLPNSGDSTFNYFSATPYNPDSAPTAVWSSESGNCTAYNLMFIRWGSTGWYKMRFEFVVPDRLYDKCWYVGYPYDITPTYIDHICPWIDVRPSSSMGGYTNPYVWFADSSLYINPVGEPVVSPAPSYTPNPSVNPTYDSYFYLTPAPMASTVIGGVGAVVGIVLMLGLLLVLCVPILRGRAD